MGPSLLVCGFGSFPAAPVNPAAAVTQRLAASNWTPEGAATRYLTLPVAWRGAAERVLDDLARAPADAVLVVGVAVEADAFRVELQGRNTAAAGRADHLGELWTEPHISPGGPARLAATIPAETALQALLGAGLPARLSQDAGDYLCNFTLYRLLEAAAAPAIGFLHVPQARECAPGAAFALDEIELAVRTTVEALALELTRPGASTATA